jgi:toxin ParE1/3/4
MADYLLGRDARRDLLEISRYTRRLWGARQRSDYLRRLDRRMKFLREHPKAGAPCDDIRPGYRRFPEGRHVVFYREAGGTIEVIRILHESMEARRQFGLDEQA